MSGPKFLYYVIPFGFDGKTEFFHTLGEATRQAQLIANHTGRDIDINQALTVPVNRDSFLKVIAGHGAGWCDSHKVIKTVPPNKWARRAHDSGLMSMH